MNKFALLFWAQIFAIMLHGQPPLPVTAAWAYSMDSLEYRMIPAEVAERVKWNILDAIGIMAYNSRLSELQPYLDQARKLKGPKEATIIGTGMRTPVETAAAHNAFLVHGAETDDNDFRGNIKTTAISIPPALAVAEWKRASGQELITAIALAYTLNGRLGALAGEMMHLLGYMPTSFFGSAGAAAAAAKIMKLDTAQTVAALGMALASAGGSFQYFYDQTEEKKVLVGRTVRTGVESAMLALEGYSGARRILEGEAGIFSSHLFALEKRLGDPEIRIKMQLGFKQLSRDLQLLEGALYAVPKFYSCSSSISPFLMGLEAYLRTTPISPEEIVHFDISRDWAKNSTFAEKIDHFAPPQTIMGAQLNMNYVIALFLYKKSAFLEDFTETDLQNPGILALAKKGRYAELPDRSAQIVLHFRNGQHITLPVYISRGQQPEPLYAEQRLDKFRRLTKDRLSPDKQEQIIHMVQTLEQAEDVAAWVRKINKLLK